MASRRENFSAQNTLKRLQEGDLRLSPSTVEGLETTLVAHAFAGNMGDFTTMMSALAKTSTVAALEDKIDALAKLQKQQLNHKQEDPEDKDPVAQLAKTIDSQFKYLSKRINKIEKGNRPPVPPNNTGGTTP